VIAERLFDFLDRRQSPERADTIVVLAGRHERKVFGIELWERGLAPELILSVGRFEWRRFYELNLPDDGGLKELVESTFYKDRHFFVRFHGTVAHPQARAIRVHKGHLGTWSEIAGLASYLRDAPRQSLLIVSTSIHLRRTADLVRRMIDPTRTRVSYVAVPELRSSLRRADLETSAKARTELYTEAGKWLLYRLAAPFASRRIA
jgi:hypothetical protein